MSDMSDYTPNKKSQIKNRHSFGTKGLCENMFIFLYNVYNQVYLQLFKLNGWHHAHVHIKKTMKMYVIDSTNLINIRVSHSGLYYLVTDFVTFLC